jgi:hypothetical protein
LPAVPEVIHLLRGAGHHTQEIHHGVLPLLALPLCARLFFGALLRERVRLRLQWLFGRVRGVRILPTEEIRDQVGGALRHGPGNVLYRLRLRHLAGLATQALEASGSARWGTRPLLCIHGEIEQRYLHGGSGRGTGTRGKVLALNAARLPGRNGRTRGG